MGVSDWLYKGADTGTKLATQNQVKNMGWGQIAKNVWNEGGYNFGKNNMGYDSSFKGKGALPANTAFQKYVSGPLKYTYEAFKGNKAQGNIGGGTGASRQLFEKVLQSPVGKYLPAAGGIMRTALSWPMTLAASGPYAMYQMNKPSTPAGYDYVKNFDKGALTGIMDETSTAADIENFSRGMMEADKNYKGTVYPADNTTLEEEFNPTKYLASEDIARRNIGVPQDGRWSGIMRNVARGPLFQSGANVGATLSGGNPLVALAGAIGSQFLPLDRRPSNLDYKYINNPENMGGLSLQGNKIQDPTGILQGLNFASGFGSNSLTGMYDKALDKNQGYLDKNELSLKDLGGTGQLTEEELAALGLTTNQLSRRNRLLDRRGFLTNRRGTINNRREDFIYGGEMIPGTGKTRNQFADEYNKAQANIGSNYEQLDKQSYTGSTASGGLGGGVQADGSYHDPYDPGYAD